MTIWRSLSGMVSVFLTSAAMEQRFTQINQQRISVYHVRKISDLTASFSVSYRDYKTLQSLTEKYGDTLELHRKEGLFWFVRQLVSRPVLFAGMIGLLLLTLAVPKFVFFVRVEGNQRIPEKQIIEAAESCGISFGTPRRSIRSEQMKNELLSLLPELQWAGVNTRGCVAVISVREHPKKEIPKSEFSVSSIVAARDGIVQSCTATRGTLLCREGQAVTEGQTLISAYTDCGLFIQADRAEGEVYAQTFRSLRAVTPSVWEIPNTTMKSFRRFGLIIGKKRINLWKGSGIWDSTCGRMYKEYYVTLPGDFRLPLALCVESVTASGSQFTKLSPPQNSGFQAFADNYLSQMMIAGEILQRQESVLESDGLVSFEGSYVCREMIGRVLPETIGEQYGKTN